MCFCIRARDAITGFLWCFQKRRSIGSLIHFFLQRANTKTWCHQNDSRPLEKSNFPSAVRWLCANVSSAKPPTKLNAWTAFAVKLANLFEYTFPAANFPSRFCAFAKKNCSIYSKEHHHHHQIIIIIVVTGGSNDYYYRKLCFQENWPRLSTRLPPWFRSKLAHSINLWPKSKLTERILFHFAWRVASTFIRLLQHWWCAGTYILRNSSAFHELWWHFISNHSRHGRENGWRRAGTRSQHRIHLYNEFSSFDVGCCAAASAPATFPTDFVCCVDCGKFFRRY